MFLSLKLTRQSLLKISHQNEFLKEKVVSDRQRKIYLYTFFCFCRPIQVLQACAAVYCTASHLLRIAHFSLIGRVSQTHTSSATTKFPLSWHPRYEAKLLTSFIPSQVVCLFCSFLSSVVLPLQAVIQV